MGSDGRTSKKLPLKNKLVSDGSAVNGNSPQIEKDNDSIRATGTTAESDINYYLDQVKQENNENPGYKTKNKS